MKKYYLAVCLASLCSINSFAGFSDQISGWDAMHVSNNQATDLVGNNHGTLNNVAAIWDGNGMVFSFNQQNNNIMIADDPSLNPTSAMSVLTWINVKNNDGNQVLLSKLQHDQMLSPTDVVSFDASNTGCQGCVKGNFTKPVFDGRYIYSISTPPIGSSSYLVRYDTQKGLNDSAAWEKFATMLLKNDSSRFDPSHYYSGYSGSVYDGQYVYFIPYNFSYENGGNHGVVLRYDTRLPLAQSSSYSYMNIKPLDGSNDLVRFKGGLFDGRYVYFTGGGVRQNTNSKVARYDTTMDFKNPNSWSYVAINKMLPVVGTTLYASMMQVDKFIYFIPNNGVFVRYDSSLAFNDVNAWTMYDVTNVTSTGISSDYSGGVFDGRYIYFSPSVGFSESMLRYDTKRPFYSPLSWTTTILREPVTGRAKAYGGVGFDGRYVYYFPYQYKTYYSGLVSSGGKLLRYDTTQPYSSALAWTQDIDMGDKQNRFGGAVYDQRYFYLMPYNTAANAMLYRLDTANSNNFAFSLNRSNYFEGAAGGMFGPSFYLSTTNGYYSLTSTATLANGWHLIAGTYDGSDVSLYVDGALVASQSASGEIIMSPANLLIGSSWLGSFAYNGQMNKIQFYNRALSLDEIKSTYYLSPYGGCGASAAKTKFCH